MASSGDLIACLSEVLGVSENTVAYPLRRLREAGLISKGKRGRGGASITAEDSAAVLIACMSSSPSKETIKAFHDIASTVNFTRHVPDDGGAVQFPLIWVLGDACLPFLQELAPEHTFLDAISALIKEAVANNLEAIVSPFSSGLESFKHRGHEPLTITVQGPHPMAAIKLAHDKGGTWEMHGYGPPRFEKWSDRSAELKEAAGRGPRDLKLQTEVAHRTFSALGTLLRS